MNNFKVMHFFSNESVNFILIPVLIFFMRIVDVSLGTIRIIFVSKGYRKYAPFIGFFEVLIWIFAISRIMKELDNVWCYFAFAGGFATGNYVGMLIESRIAIGFELIRVITKRDATNLINNLREKGYGLTTVSAQGMEGDVGILYIVSSRRKIKEAIEIIKEFNPKAFYTIEDIRFVNKDVFYKYAPDIRKKGTGLGSA